MTLESIRQKIFATLATSWATATPVAWPNQRFEPPAQGEWIRPVIKIPITTVGELGDDGVGLRDGLLMISVFGRSDTGSSRASQLADRLEAIFRRKDIDNLWLDEPSSNPQGNDPNGFYHILMTVDFHCWVGET